jgi:ABC-2 type transport system permease protein
MDFVKNALIVAKKDFDSYFRSPAGALIFTFFLLVSGIFFSILVLSYAKLSINAAQNAYQNTQGLGLTRFVFSSYFLNMGSILVFLIPFLSMRAIAEERKQETLELLYTYPLSDLEIVWGKFLGMLAFGGLLAVPTLLYIVLVRGFGGEPDWGPVLIGYAGFFLLMGAYFSLGLFVSSISANPVISAIVTFGCLTVFWILDWVVGITDGTLSRFLAAVSPLGHYREFAIGILDLSDAVYFIFFIVYFLFLSLRSIETRNWKG